MGITWRASLPLLCAFSLNASCTQVDFVNNLEILTAPDQDPLAGASTLEISIQYADGEIIEGELTVSPGAQEVAGLRPGSGVRIQVVARDYDGIPISLGKTGPIEIGEGGIDAAVFLGTADSLARIPSALSEARSFSSLLALGDEHFVILGGGNSDGSSVSAVEFLGGDQGEPLSPEVIAETTRVGHQALYLSDQEPNDFDEWAGHIVLVGGTTSSNDDTWSGGVDGAIDSVTLLNPRSGELTSGAAYFEAGVLGASSAITPEGQIAVVGGIDDDGGFRTTVEILLPGETFPIAGPEIQGRVMQEFTTIEVGGELRYFLTGGLGAAGLIDTVEIWDGRQTSDFIAPPGMTLEVARARHQATPMSNGRILISGGAGNLSDRTEQGLSIPSGEIVDVETNEVWTIGDTLDVPRQRHVAVPIADDRVLLCGGVNDAGEALGSCEVYDSESSSFHGFLGGSLSPGGAGVSAASLPDGRVFFAGGGSSQSADNSLYIYTPPVWQN